MKINTVIDYKFSAEGAEPITLAQAKEWLKISPDITTEEGLIMECAAAARLKVEKRTGISLIARTVELFYPEMHSPVKLMFGPVNTITSVKNSNGDTIEAGNYSLKGVNDKLLYYNSCGPVTVTFTTSGAFDADYGKLIEKELAWIYERRGDELETRNISGVDKSVNEKRRYI